MGKWSLNISAFWGLHWGVALLILAVPNSWALTRMIQSPQVHNSRNVMVASRQGVASQVGSQILQDGGNAIDAAVAVALALAVVLPQAGNLGGGGFLLYYRAEDQMTTVIDFRETAPRLASRDMFLDAMGSVDNDRAQVGHLSVGVPGTLAGLHLAWSKYGSLPWSQLVTPAIELAQKGFTINQELATVLKAQHNKLLRFPSTAQIFINGEVPYLEGDILVQEQLAATLELIAENGPRSFYEGTIAHRLADDMNINGGLITLQDLEHYKPVERQPLSGQYKDLTVIGVPPPSSGGITLLQALEMLEPFELQEKTPTSWFNVHLVVEVLSRVFADRNTYLGDPAFVRMPIQGLLSESYAKARAWRISLDRATPSGFVSSGRAWDHQKTSSGHDHKHVIQKSPASGVEPNETTHFSIVDSRRNIVALTTTLNSNFGSGIVVPGTGFLLNNEMDDFAAAPGAANQFGLVGNETNAIDPQKRMLSSMSPTIILRHGKPWLVLGARGGPRIITAVLQILLNRYEFHMSLEAAVAAPRYHFQWQPDVVYYEDEALTKSALKALRQMGHRLSPLRPNASSAQCIEILRDGWLVGVCDPRGGGYPNGY